MLPSLREEGLTAGEVLDTNMGSGQWQLDLAGQ